MLFAGKIDPLVSVTAQEAERDERGKKVLKGFPIRAFSSYWRRTEMHNSWSRKEKLGVFSCKIQNRWIYFLLSLLFHHCPQLFLSQLFGLMKTYKLLRDMLPVLCSICLSSLRRFHGWHKPAWNLKWASSWTLLLKGFPSGLRSAQLTEEHKICLETQLVTFHQLKLRFTCQAKF